MNGADHCVVCGRANSRVDVSWELVCHECYQDRKRGYDIYYGWRIAWQGVTIGILKQALSAFVTDCNSWHSVACHRDMYAGSDKPCSCGLDVALAVRGEMMEDV